MKVKEDLAPTVINKAKISIGLMPKDYGKKKLVFIPAMIALLCLGSWSQTAWASPCIVTRTNDSGANTLRSCITYANANPGTTISFNIPAIDPGKITVGINSRWRIIPLTALPTISASNTIIDGTTQAAFIGGDPNTLGPEIELFGNGAAFNGLRITSANNTVKGLIIGGFSGVGADGLYINGGTGNTVTGNYIGTDYQATTAQANRYGLVLDNGAASNTIGGTNPLARNVISGNTYGIWITGVGTNSHLIQGNYIGTNAAGTASIGNSWGLVLDNSAASSTIGGTDPLARNVISGNTYGIWITGVGTNNHLVQGNYIGTNAAGTAPVANSYALLLENSAASSTIGGTDPLARNVISGNTYGIWIIGVGTNSHLIQGNYIGINAAGTAQLANTFGVCIQSGAKTTQIGGTNPNARNVISGNTYAIFITDAGTDSHLIQGNYIGTDASGTAQIANVFGVYIGTGAKTTQIGGTDPNARNVISGSTYGIYIAGAGADSHLIQGNYIGTNAAGTAAISNSNNGISIAADAKSTIIGGTAAGAANLIAYNSAGIGISGAATYGNIFSANSIFNNTGLGISLAPDGNNNKAAPMIQSIIASGSNFIVTATVPKTGDTIQFFRANNTSSPTVIPDSPAGEGYLFLGSCVDNGAVCVGPYVSGSDTNAAAGAVSVTLTGGGLTQGDTLSATATDAANGTSQFSTNKLVPLKLIKQTYNTSGVCIASSDASDAGCGSTSVVTVPAGVVVKFMIIVKNTSAQAVTDVRFEDILDESPTGFSYIPGSMFSTPVGVSAPVDTASNGVIYTAATNIVTDGTGDDIGSARDTGGPAGADNISIGNVNPGGINTQLDINAHKSFAVIFQARKK